MNKNKAIGGNVETVLVLPGGTPLGAFTAGVYKALVSNNVKIDIVAGTGVGAINAAIIATSNGDRQEMALEDFWIEVAENISNQNAQLEECLGKQSSLLTGKYSANKDVANSFLSSLEYIPLQKILENHFDSVKLTNPQSSRLILKGVDVLNFKPSIFDSKYDNISTRYILAVSGYTLGDLPWEEINGRLLRDASALSTSPLREVINASPLLDKQVFMVNDMPTTMNNDSSNDHKLNEKNIMAYDSTTSDIRISKIITRYLSLLESMYNILDKAKLNEQSKESFSRIKSEYHKLVQQRGAKIRSIVRITRDKERYNVLKKDFSPRTVKNLIDAGESIANGILKITDTS